MTENEKEKEEEGEEGERDERFWPSRKRRDKNRVAGRKRKTGVTIVEICS